MRTQMIEDWIKEFSVPYRYVESLKISDLPEIDLDIHQIRLGRLTDDHIHEMTVALKNGAQFAPIVLSENGDSKMSMHYIDGIHRVTVYRREKVSATDAYIIKCDPNTRDLLQRTANVRHGLPLSTEERIENALQLIGQGRATIADTTRLFLVPEHRIRAYMRAKTVNVELRKAGFKGKLNQTQLLALSPVPRNAARAQLADLIIKAGLTTEEVKQEVTNLCKCASDVEMDSFLARLSGKYAERIQRSGGGRIKIQNPYVRAGNLMEKIDAYIHAAPKPGSFTRRALTDVIVQFERTDKSLHKRLDEMRRLLRTM